MCVSGVRSPTAILRQSHGATACFRPNVEDVERYWPRGVAATVTTRAAARFVARTSWLAIIMRVIAACCSVR